jgi:hypothetical protein
VEADNLRLRAALIRSRTAVLWGLPPVPLSVPTRRPLPRSAPPLVEHQWREAQAVICQTACAGHAHPWRDDKGQCQRSGQACDRAPEPANKAQR